MTPPLRFFRSSFRAGIFLLVLMAVPIMLMWRAWRREQRNRELAHALQAHHRFEALRLLEQGADPNVCLFSDEPPVSLWYWVRLKLRGERIRQPSGYPCLLWELGIEAQIPPTRYRPKPPPEDPVLVSALLERGAEVNVQGQGEAKKTPLMLAALNNYERVACLLLRYHAQVDAVDEQGQTALLLAVQHSKTSLALLTALLEQGANINAQDKLGSTALMLAVEHRNKDAVRFLLARHANVYLSQQDGWTALRYAEDIEDHRRDSSLITLLQHAGASNQPTLSSIRK